MKFKSILKNLVYGGALAGIISTGITCHEYADFPGFGNKAQAGRAKNSIAAIVAGVVGKQMYGASIIDLDIEKTLYPDARVVGRTSSDSIDTVVDLNLTSARFSAKENHAGHLEGTVDKSDFDWSVVQTSEHFYEIDRFGPKFNGALEIMVKDGKIWGTYIREGPHFDWNIRGTYDEKGNVRCEIDGPMSLGIVLRGKIRKE